MDLRFVMGVNFSDSDLLVEALKEVIAQIENGNSGKKIEVIADGEPVVQGDWYCIQIQILLKNYEK